MCRKCPPPPLPPSTPRGADFSFSTLDDAPSPCLSAPARVCAFCSLLLIGRTGSDMHTTVMHGYGYCGFVLRVEQFASFAASFCRQIRDAGFWADYIDPCSGLPVSACFSSRSLWFFRCTPRVGLLPTRYYPRIYGGGQTDRLKKVVTLHLRRTAVTTDEVSVAARDCLLVCIRDPCPCFFFDRPTARHGKG